MPARTTTNVQTHASEINAKNIPSVGKNEALGDHQIMMLHELLCTTLNVFLFITGTPLIASGQSAGS